MSSKTSDLDFLVSTLDHHGIPKESVQSLIDQFKELKKLENDRKKMIKDDKPALISALVSKYCEIKYKLDALVDGKSDLFVKKTRNLTACSIRFREALKNHTLGEEKLRQVFPLFFEGL